MNSYPTTLPGPSQITLRPAERRRVSSIPQGLQQVAGRQRDFLAIEEVQFHFTATQAEIFDTWWKGQIVYGGGWFAAYWPVSHKMSVGNRRFTESPKWTLIGHEYWQVSCQFELRGSLNNSPSGGGVGMEPGGTRLYDLRMTAITYSGSYPFGSILGSSTSGSVILLNPYATESSYTIYFRVVLHNTDVLVSTGASVRISLTSSRITPTDPFLVTPVYGDLVSATSRVASWSNDSSGGSNVSGFTLTAGRTDAHLFTGFRYEAKAYVDGVEIAQDCSFTHNPDNTSGTTTGGGITGYPSGQYLSAAFTWSSSF